MTRLLLVAVVAAGCATHPPAARLSPEHVPPYANPTTEAQAMATMTAALYPEAAALAEARATVAAMNAEHDALGDEPDHGLEQTDGALPGTPPSDWATWENRRDARGSSLDWQPIGTGQAPCIVMPAPTAAPTPTTARPAGPLGALAALVPSGLRNPADPVPLVTPAATSALLPTVEGHGVVFSAGASGAVCTELIRAGVTEQRCIPVAALRAWLHGQ